MFALVGMSSCASVSPLRMNTKSALACNAWARKKIKFSRDSGDSLYTYVMMVFSTSGAADVDGAGTGDATTVAGEVTVTSTCAVCVITIVCVAAIMGCSIPGGLNIPPLILLSGTEAEEGICLCSRQSVSLRLQREWNVWLTSEMYTAIMKIHATDTNLIHLGAL